MVGELLGTLCLSEAVDITSLICFGPVVAKDLHSRRQLIQFLA